MESQRWLPGTLSRWQVIPRWLRSIWWGINIQTSQQASTRKENPLWSLDYPVTRIIQVTGKTITRKTLMPRMSTGTRKDVRSVEIQITLKVSSVQPRNFNANLVTSMGTSQASVTRRNKLHLSKGSQRLICYKRVLFMLVINQFAVTQKIVHPVMSLQVKIQQSQAEGKKIPTSSHFITNLAYKLKPCRKETSISEQDWTLVQMLTSCQPVITNWYLMILN